MLPAKVIQSQIKQTATLIFLHGLGDNGDGWADILQTTVPPYCKIICPHAKSMPVTLNGGMSMPAWHDIYGLSPNAKQDETGIQCATNELEKFVQSEINSGIQPSRVLIGGFSQGGSIALYYAITTNHHPVGGIIALSSWLPLHSKFEQNPELIKGDRNLSIFQCHGQADCVIPYDMGLTTHKYLKMLGFSNSCFYSFQNMGHSSSDEEMLKIKNYMKEILPEAVSS